MQQDGGPDWRIGVDIGGTFMDFCALDTRSGQMETLKVLTTPQDPGAELLTGIDMLEARGLRAEAVSRFVHGTTVGINTIIQRRGAKLALVTNAGFEDVLELARLRMPEMYSLFCNRAEPLIPRDRIFGLSARMRADGSVAKSVSEQDLTDIVHKLQAAGVEGVIVSMLHSWRDGSQEQAIKAQIERSAPELFVFASSEVWPVIREYERSSTAILNGYVHPRVSGYLEALEARLLGRGVPTKALLTRSNGGLMSAGQGRRDCVSMLLSGTASGVIGASWLARQAKEDRILTLDIGGTSADFALIIDGAVQFGTDEKIGDFPLHIPSVSVSSIGIGGGSIASVDASGVLRVGPESAGSTPGPSCYGRGGTQPTVTDAMAVLGWLGHAEMAYGQLSMDRDLACSALEPLAKALSCSLEVCAQAIVEIAVSEMFVEVEKLSSRAGVDLRDYALMPFGGGGPMLGAFLARELGLRRVLVPRRPGVVSALGGLVAELRGDFVRTVHLSLSQRHLPVFQSEVETLASDGKAWLQAQGYAGPAVLKLSAGMRYQGQSYEIEVALEQDWLSSAKGIGKISEAFHETHKRIYAFDDPDGAIEVITLRLSSIGAGAAPDLPKPDFAPTQAVGARSVSVFVNGWCDVPLYDRADLAPGAEFSGPAIVAQEDTTFAVPPGCAVRVDVHDNIHLEFAG